MLSSRATKKGGENLPANFKKKIQRENNDRIKTNLLQKLQAMEAEIQSHIPQQSNEFIMKFINNKFRFESYLVQAKILIRYDDFKEGLVLLK
jgi:hypothetical protein